MSWISQTRLGPRAENLLQVTMSLILYKCQTRSRTLTMVLAYPRQSQKHPSALEPQSLEATGVVRQVQRR
jgi:hypothetical protein